MTSWLIRGPATGGAIPGCGSAWPGPTATSPACASSPSGPWPIRRPPGAGGSLAKLAWAHCDQELANLAVDLIGPGALGDRWGENLLSVRQASIAGGTSEINRNIVAERVLGLPR